MTRKQYLKKYYFDLFTTSTKTTIWNLSNKDISHNNKAGDKTV